ncbi:MAG: DUF3096 domain-containing protein [Dehalococcoidales bacterium]|jgi:uncharacterized membrane protein HdeD (DUF308 family)
MKISGRAMGVLFIVFGILVLIFPNILEWLVGIFFIVAGILSLMRQ